MKENKGNKKKIVSLAIDSKLYKMLHKTLEPIVDECGLEFNESGLSILTQSPCKTMLCDMTIGAEVFNDYNLVESFEVGWDFVMAETKGLMKDYNQGLIWIDIFEIAKETLQKVSERSETIGVVFDNETVWFSNQYEVHNWVTEGIIVSSNETGKALYTSDAMHDIVSSIPNETNIVFKFASDFPCKLSYEIVEGFEIEWMLAPRLESD